MIHLSLLFPQGGMDGLHLWKGTKQKRNPREVSGNCTLFLSFLFLWLHSWLSLFLDYSSLFSNKELSQQQGFEGGSERRKWRGHQTQKTWRKRRHRSKLLNSLLVNKKNKNSSNQKKICKKRCVCFKARGSWSWERKLKQRRALFLSKVCSNSKLTLSAKWEDEEGDERDKKKRLHRTFRSINPLSLSLFSFVRCLCMTYQVLLFFLRPILFAMDEERREISAVIVVTEGCCVRSMAPYSI